MVDWFSADGHGAEPGTAPGASNGSVPGPAARYALRDEVAIEDFDDGSLVLLCEQLRLVQLNPVARDVVGRLDGRRTVRQVAECVARDYDHPLEEVLADVGELLAHLEAQGVVEYCNGAEPRRNADG